MADLAASAPKLLNIIFDDRLAHLNLRGQIEGLTQAAGAIGASCDVYTGRWRNGDRLVKVAVKKLRFFCSNEPAIAKKLAKEAYIWSKLNHRNVLPLLGFFLDDNGQFPHLVSEWMVKGTLFDYLKILEHAEETIRMAEGIAAGLSYLHDKKVIHADLKSQNILISDSKLPLIADFGVSYIMSASMATMCGTGRISPKGTARWTAFELFDINQTTTIPTEKSDVWAFGMVIYELLTRRLPYYNLTSEHLVTLAIANGKLPDEPPRPPAMSLPQFMTLRKISMRCWAKNPKERPGIGTLRRDIERAFSEIFGLDIDAELSELYHLGLHVAIVPPQARVDWFAAMNPYVPPERQLNVNLQVVRTFTNVMPERKPGFFNLIRFSADGKWLALKTFDGITIFNTETGADIWSVHGSFLRFYSSPDGKYLAVQDYHMFHLSVWDVVAQKFIFEIPNEGANDSLIAAEFFRTGPYIATLSRDGSFSIWEIKTEHLLKKTRLILPHGSRPQFGHESAVSLNDKFVAGALGDGIVYIWESSSGELVCLCSENVPMLSSDRPDINFTFDGKGIVGWTRDEMKIWDITALNSPSLPGLNVQTKESLSICTPTTTTRLGSNEKIRAVSYDGQWVVSASENRVWFWDAQTSQKRLMLQQSESVERIVLSPQGGLLATLSSNVDGSLFDPSWVPVTTIKLWRYSTVC